MISHTITYSISNIIFLLAVKSNQKVGCGDPSGRASTYLQSLFRAPQNLQEEEEMKKNWEMSSKYRGEISRPNEKYTNKVNSVERKINLFANEQLFIFLKSTVGSILTFSTYFSILGILKYFMYTYLHWHIYLTSIIL